MVLFSKPQTTVANVFGQMKKKIPFLTSYLERVPRPKQGKAKQDMIPRSTWIENTELRVQRQKCGWRLQHRFLREQIFTKVALCIWIESEYWSILVFEKTKKNAKKLKNNAQFLTQGWESAYSTSQTRQT